MIRFIPAIVAFLLLGAHFLRYDNVLLTGFCALIPLLLLVKKRWTLLTVQWSACVGALVWANTATVLTKSRIAAGAPFGRMLLILSGVMIFTLFAAYLLGSDTVKRRYPKKLSNVKTSSNL